MIARSVLSWLASVNSTVSSVNVEVLSSHRGRGIGTELLDRMERIARASGRATVQSHVEHPALASESAVCPPTGFGKVSLDDPGARFLANRGYALEQVKRISFLGLPLDPGRSMTSCTPPGARPVRRSVAKGTELTLANGVNRVPGRWGQSRGHYYKHSTAGHR